MLLEWGLLSVTIFCPSPTSFDSFLDPQYNSGMNNILTSGGICTGREGLPWVQSTVRKSHDSTREKALCLGRSHNVNDLTLTTKDFEARDLRKPYFTSVRNKVWIRVCLDATTCCLMLSP